MNINIDDDVEGFQGGITVKGKLVSAGILGVVLVDSSGSCNLLHFDNILKVNGKVYTDKPAEVYTKEPNECQEVAKQLSGMFDRLIAECES